MKSIVIFLGFLVFFYIGVAHADPQKQINYFLELLQQKKYSEAKELVGQWRRDNPEEHEDIAFCEGVLSKVEAEPNSELKEAIVVNELSVFFNKQMNDAKDVLEKFNQASEKLDQTKQTFPQLAEDIKNTKVQFKEPYSSNDPTENLHDAVLEENTNKVDEFITKGADVNKAELMGFTPIMWACQNGNLEMVRKLIAHGAKLNIEGDLGQTPLTLAVAKGNVPLVEYLLNQGVDVQQKTREGNTLLMEAVRLKDLDLVRIFVEKRVDVNAWNVAQQTALMLAVKNNDLRIVEHLLDHGAKPTMRNLSDKTALDLAKEEGYQEIVDLFIRKSAQ